jgi:hypothetical protein
MRTVMAAVLAAFVVVLLAAAIGGAQPSRGPQTILSGPDIGFRVDSTDREGRALGRLMVRIDGQWVEAGSAPAVRPVR